MQWSQLFVTVIGIALSNQAATDTCNGKNLVQTKMVATQSSVYKNELNIPYSAQRAVDGMEMLCAHTMDLGNSWWRIDLQGLYEVSCIRINNQNSQYDLSGSQIFIGNSTESNGITNTLCRNITDSLTSVIRNYTCHSPIRGRYVTVNMEKKQFLALCEVEIYGTEKGSWKLIKEHKTWDEALYHCRDMDMDLVSILDNDTQAFVALVAKDATTPLVWLGLHYTCVLEFWFWVADHSLGFQHWDPHSSALRGCDTSAAMNITGNNYWYTESDYKLFNFVCES